jgi:hypothetical protein
VFRADIPGSECQRRNAIGRSRGGLTAKIRAVAHALGNPVALSIAPGQAAGITQAEPFLDRIETAAPVAGKG